MLEQMNGTQGTLWECKDCHRLIPAIETVAFHLVDRILYGWCETCFSHETAALKRELAQAS